ncbi:hypothetical protein [Halomonas daqiaonensis]|uniref:hypothetical protein n=1 Tax=Halomonas daqiaonensis TaxID=650850 RepID=UPI001479B382|nr:hypothetical protein [Halomonas daqiaonensis]
MSQTTSTTLAGSPSVFRAIVTARPDLSLPTIPAQHDRPFRFIMTDFGHFPESAVMMPESHLTPWNYSDFYGIPLLSPLLLEEAMPAPASP